MALRAGYKQTEVGVIPEDWEACPLSSIGSFSKGQGVRKNEAASGEIPCIRYGEIYTHHNDVVRAYNSYISREVAETSRRLAKGDVLFAGSGETKEEIGKAVAFLGREEAYAGGDIVILSPRNQSSEFLGYLLNAPMVVRQKASKGQGDAVVHISATALGTVVVPLPPFDEQRAIATALSDVDALLAVQDKLIAKKRDIKQAAMQQLLTGKQRLPGFSGEWEVKRLGDVATVLKGSGLSKGKVSQAGKSKCILYGELFTTYSRIIAKVCSSTDANEGLPSVYGDVLLPGSTTTVGLDLATASALLCDGVMLGGDINVVRAKGRSYSPEFLAYLLTEEKRNQIAEMAQGITIIHLYGKSLLKLEICLPSLEEQTSIAAILSDMDAEIAGLEKQLDKTRALKQGMMQELLTGRIRLV